MNNLITRAKELLENKTVRLLLVMKPDQQVLHVRFYYQPVKMQINLFMMNAVFRTLQFILLKHEVKKLGKWQLWPLFR